MVTLVWPNMPPRVYCGMLVGLEIYGPSASGPIPFDGTRLSSKRAFFRFRAMASLVTGGLAAQALVQRGKEEMLTELKNAGGFQYSWVHDGLGAVDVIMLITAMNISCGILVVVCPAIAAVHMTWDPQNESVQKALVVGAESVGIGSVAAMAILRILFYFANILFGAPGRLSNAVVGVLTASEVGKIEKNDPRETAQGFLSKQAEEQFNAGAEGTARALQALAGKVLEVDARRLRSVTGVRSPHVTTKGLLWSIFSNGGMCLSISPEHFDLFVSLSQVGYVMALADPEYETMKKIGFQRQFMTDCVSIQRHTLLNEKDGTWTVIHKFPDLPYPQKPFTYKNLRDAECWFNAGDEQATSTRQAHDEHATNTREARDQQATSTRQAEENRAGTTQ